MNRSVLFLFIILFHLKLVYSQDFEQSVENIFHPHVFNPALQIHNDSLEFKYFCHYYKNNQTGTFKQTLFHQSISTEASFPKWKSMLGGEIEKAYSFINVFDINGSDIEVKNNEIAVSVFGNTEVARHFLVGAGFNFNWVKHSSLNITNDILRRWDERYAGFIAGISYIPGNYIFGFSLCNDDLSENSLEFHFQAGYKVERETSEILLLVNYTDATLFRSDLNVNALFEYRNILDIALYGASYLKNFSFSTTSFGLSVGTYFFNTRLRAGLGLNNFTFKREEINQHFFSLYLVYAL